MKLVLVSQVGNTLQNPDGSTRSLNPKGTTPETYEWQTRVVGQSYGTPPQVWTGPGAYEFQTVNGNIVTYNPTGKEAVSFLFIPTVPNWTGCAFCETPLD